MHHLVIGALQERRVDDCERFVAFGGEARREGDGMLLGNADIEGAVGEFLAEQIEPGARGHCGCDGDDLGVLLGLLDEAFGEHLGVGGGGRLGLGLGAGGDVEGHHAVILVGRGLGGRIALALLGDDMDQDRPGLGVAHVLQHRHQMIEIVPVDRPHIVEAQLLEHGAAGDERAGVLLDLHRALLKEFRQPVRELLAYLAE